MDPSTVSRGGQAIRGDGHAIRGAGHAIQGAGHAIRELPEAERPRERLALRGPGGLTTAELIALLWGSGGSRPIRGGHRH